MKPSTQPVFIVGAPRSGTTWLLSLLEHHPQCLAVTPQALGITPPRPTKETGIFLRGLSSREIVDRFSRLPTNRVPVEKTPGHLLQVGRIKRVFPGARVVLVRRDPKDVIWSMLQKNEFWQGSPRTLSEAVSLYTEFAQAAAIYSGYDAVVDYAALWENPTKVLARLLSELRLDPQPAADLVAKAHAGSSLPTSLAAVYREGTPGQGAKHLCSEDQALIQAAVPASTPSHSVLLATNHLLGWTGSETLLLTLIDGLLKANCRLTIYARHWNENWLDAHFDKRLRITNDLASIKRSTFDLAHVQHNSCLVDVRATFPTLPVIFSSLGVLPFLEQPAPLPLCVSHYLAISEEVAGNLSKHGIPADQITILRNLVDSDSFVPRSSIHDKPDRILVLSYKIDSEKAERLRAAAMKIGASIRFAGATGDSISQERVVDAINAADVVVSLGRGVIEAMLCGRVPLVYDAHGGDGLVIPENIDDLRTCNFSGRRYRREFTVDDLVAELMKYRQEYGAALREIAFAQFSIKHNLPEVISLYSRVRSRPMPIAIDEQALKLLTFVSGVAREDAKLASGAQMAAERLMEEVARIKGTISWRITAPLRAFWNVYLKIRGNSRS